ncbi:acyltransferase [Planctomicrobium sp. SH527]|uniref:acyltransferase n=1 Tax=Planctomicrobium sp. SH527 TaxID=3448123 RepID=UPI003F5B96F2
MPQPLMARRHPGLPPSQVDISDLASFGQDVKIDLTGDLTIGDGSHLAHRVSVITHTHANLTGPIRLGKVGPPVGCPLVIGKHVFIGENAVILPSVNSIGDWAVIGAYSVLTKPVGAGEVWAGNPARFLRCREEWGLPERDARSVAESRRNSPLDQDLREPAAKVPDRPLSHSLAEILQEIARISSDARTVELARRGLGLLQETAYRVEPVRGP